MFQLCSKLKKQKVVLKKLNKEEFSNLPDRVKRAKESMEAAQEFVQLNPMNGEGIRAEVMAVHEYALLRRSEESFYKKKSRVQWSWGSDLKDLCRRAFHTGRRFVNIEKIHSFV